MDRINLIVCSWSDPLSPSPRTGKKIDCIKLAWEFIDPFYQPDQPLTFTKQESEFENSPLVLVSVPRNPTSLASPPSLKPTSLFWGTSRPFGRFYICPFSSSSFLPTIPNNHKIESLQFWSFVFFLKRLSFIEGHLPLKIVSKVVFHWRLSHH